MRKKKQLGFTLIEMLVVVTIVILLTGTVITNYIRYNDRQQVMTAAEELKTFIRSAQRRAQVLDSPPTCSVTNDPPNPVQAYRVYTQGSVIRMAANCGEITPTTLPATTPVASSIRELRLRSGVTLASTLDVRFWVLYGGAEIIQGDGTITLTKGSYSYIFNVRSDGVITKGALISL